MRKKVLFLCTGNSCRSQMAEGWAKVLLPERLEPFSAGTTPHPLNTLAVKVMQECGVDISQGQPKTLASLGDINFDLVVTVCDDAATNCPIPPNNSRIVHVPFDDPPRLTANLTEEVEILKIYRRVRDEIKEFVAKLPSFIGENE